MSIGTQELEKAESDMLGLDPKTDASTVELAKDIKRIRNAHERHVASPSPDIFLEYIPIGRSKRIEVRDSICSSCFRDVVFRMRGNCGP